MIKGFFKSKDKSKVNIELPVLPESDIREVREFALKGWKLGDTHGLSHWQRVERNSILLSTSNGCIREDIHIKVVRFFAYLHDKCRLNDWADMEHGVRAADMLPTIRDTILKDLTDEEVTQYFGLPTVKLFAISVDVRTFSKYSHCSQFALSFCFHQNHIIKIGGVLF